MPQASPHFSIGELTATSCGLDNTPNVEQGAALVRLAVSCLEPMRALVGPLRINSGFRSPEVNRHVGGVITSQHLRGEAADIDPVEVSPSVLFDLTRVSQIPFDQLILEPNWVHVSCAPVGKIPQHQVLKARVTTKGMVYEPIRG